MSTFICWPKIFCLPAEQSLPTEREREGERVPLNLGSAQLQHSPNSIPPGKASTKRCWIATKYDCYVIALRDDWSFRSVLDSPVTVLMSKRREKESRNRYDGVTQYPATLDVPDLCHSPRCRNVMRLPCVLACFLTATTKIKLFLKIFAFRFGFRQLPSITWFGFGEINWRRWTALERRKRIARLCRRIAVASFYWSYKKPGRRSVICNECSPCSRGRWAVRLLLIFHKPYEWLDCVYRFRKNSQRYCPATKQPPNSFSFSITKFNASLGWSSLCKDFVC